MSKTVLVVEDDPDMREFLTVCLEGANFQVLAVADGASALDKFASHTPDLVVLDVGLGSMDGYAVCSKIRALSQVPVVFLSARDGEVDQLVGLSAGADDYLIKPVSGRVLVAKVAAILKRVGVEPSSPRSSAGCLTIDTDARSAFAGGTEVELTRTEFDILAILMATPKRVVPRSELINRVWESYYGSDNLVEVHVSRLRSKIRTASGVSVVEAVRGVGYRLGDVSEKPAGN